MSPKDVFGIYRQRWEIETLFSCLKTRGLNFEDTHVTKHDRLSRIFGVLSIALVCCLNTGEFLIRHKEILIKNHQRKARSIFRLGWKQLAFAITNYYQNSQRFRRMVNLFSLTNCHQELDKLSPLLW